MLGALAYLARALSPGDYGEVETAFAVNVFFVLGVEGGMSAYGARIVAADPSSVRALLPRIMLLRVLASIPVLVAALGFFAWSGSIVARILSVSAWAVLVTPFFTQWVFQGLRRMHWVAAGSAIRNFVLAAMIVLLVRPGSDIRFVGLAELAGVVSLGFFNSVILYGVMGQRLDLTGLWPHTRRLFGDVWPLGLSDFTWACLWYSPVLLTASVGSAADAAWIGAPVRVVLALHTFVWLYFVNLLPSLASSVSEDVASWRAIMGSSLRASIWIGGLVGVSGTLSADWGIPLLFGHDFTPAIAPFKVVIWVIPVVWFSGNFRFTLIATGQQRHELRALIGGAVVTVVGTFALAPSLGGLGAAVAFLAGGICNAWLAVRATGIVIGPVRWGRGLLECAGVVCLCLLAGTLLSRPLGGVAATAVATAAYLGVACWQNAEIWPIVRGLLGRQSVASPDSWPERDV